MGRTRPSPGTPENCVSGTGQVRCGVSSCPFSSYVASLMNGMVSEKHSEPVAASVCAPFHTRT